MLKYIIAVTNTALPPALVAGAFLALYESRMGPRSGRPLRTGFVIGAAASLALVILKRNTGFVVREYYNLGVLFPSLAVEALLVVLTWLPPGNPLSGKPRKALALASLLAIALWVGYSLPDLLFYPLDFSVGMDTVFNTLYAYKVTGYAFGLLLSLLALSATAAIARQLPPPAVKGMFQAAVLVCIGRQVLSVLQIGLGRNLIPR